MNQPIISTNSNAVVTQNYSTGTVTISSPYGLAIGSGATATSYGYAVNSSCNSFQGEWMLVSDKQKQAIKLQ